MHRFYLFFALLALTAGFAPRPVLAQTAHQKPWQWVDDLHTHLFEAQNSLLGQQPEQATTHLQQAEQLLSQELAVFPAVTQTYLSQALDQAHTAVNQHDGQTLAVAVGQIEGAVFWGSYQLTTEAVTAGSASTAQQWLLVRDYRPSTRFSRPNADATLALTQLGQLSAEEVLARLEADLLDTYQGQFNQLLQTAGSAELLPSRQAEAAGRASAYWHILAPAYTEQNGAEAEQTVSNLLLELTQQVQKGQTVEANQTVTLLQTQLASFRAAPLSPADQTRRAGQLLRFLALVPVEYGRGVTENTVLQPFEIQEALTFLQGAQAAFTDLSLALNELNPTQTAQIQGQLEQLAAILDQTNRQTAVAHPDEVEQLVADITAGLKTLFPAGWLEQNSEADFDVLAEVLNQLEAAVKQGDYALAESTRLEAYAIFDFGPEPRLLAYNPELVAQIDGLFWQGYNGQVGLAQALALEATPAEVQTIRTHLDKALQTAQLTLGDLPNSPFAIALNAAIIVFREGLESVVILAALMASMVGANARYRRPLALGAGLSLVGTAITWWLAQMVLTSLAQYGEKLEAVVSLIAIGVLLLITNWFFHKTYWNDWMAGFHQQKQQLLRAETGQFLGLIALGFTSMYREGFETVLFLQALVLDAGVTVVGQGVLLGSVGVLVVGLITFRVQQRLPYRQMLVWTGILIGLVLVTMVGKTIHVLQAVGWVGITPIRAITFPYWSGLWLGLFATWQGVIWQVLAVVFVVGSYYGAEWLQSRKRQQLKEQRPMAKAQS